MDSSSDKLDGGAVRRPQGSRRHFSSRQPWRFVASLFWSVIQVGLVAVILAMVWFRLPSAKPNSALPTVGVAIDDGPTLGSRSAPLAIVEFADFECPSCAKFAHEVLPELRSKYIDTQRVSFTFKQFPLTKTHPRAQRAAEASLCAWKQARFWEIAHEMFRIQDRLTDHELRSLATNLGLDQTRFDGCLTSGDQQLASLINRNIEEGKALGVSGTPMFFFVRREPDGTGKVIHRVDGLVALDKFAASLELALKPAEPSR